VCIARALATGPDLLVADEPLSALDVSVQAQIITLLNPLKSTLALTMIVISHNIAVLDYICDRVAVLYLGRVVEIGPTSEVLRRPRHPYAQALLSAVLRPDRSAARGRIILPGDPPSPMRPPPGCAFHTRCRHAETACADAAPTLRIVGADHASACIRNEFVGIASTLAP
jgi:oligopeptide/dipeptide ABC transporter ATP-binding protein